MLAHDIISQEGLRMTAAVHVASFHSGDHICFFYRDAEEQLDTAAPFVQIGLLRGERCLVVLSNEKMQQLLARLEHAGIDTEKEIQRGDLMPCTPEEVYLKGGKFDRDMMIKSLDDSMREALKLGLNCFRATGDLGWAVGDSAVCGQLPEYESLLDKYYPGKPCLGICMYDVNTFDEATLARVMDAHRIALTAPSPSKRAIRIRNGSAFGDVIFDRTSPQLFHYTVQKTGSHELLNLGQESSLTGAVDAVESALLFLSSSTA
jgi:MEDS: MEthanogen/methylotroph, DcmR Sensory domain